MLKYGEKIDIGRNNFAERSANGRNNKTLPDLKDFPIRFPGHPKFNSKKIVETDPIETITQKLELLLFTNKGEILGNPLYGADLEKYLWETQLAVDVIDRDLRSQINIYIPELNKMGYYLEINLFDGDIRDIMQINFNIKGYNFIYIWA
jgi:hypothetical protein